ncbi:MAG TPA: SOS response-associated peptidase family protein [Woeseiaceae bacterium]
MCGRFAFYSPAEAAAALFEFDASLPTEPRYNIAPTQLIPVVLQPDTAGAWLAGEPRILDRVAAAPPEFQAWPVDRKVNNARTEGPELILKATTV